MFSVSISSFWTLYILYFYTLYFEHFISKFKKTVIILIITIILDTIIVIWNFHSVPALVVIDWIAVNMQRGKRQQNLNIYWSSACNKLFITSNYLANKRKKAWFKFQLDSHCKTYTVTEVLSVASVMTWHC